MSEVCVSIVSHGQAFLASQLLDDFGHHCPDVQLLVTSNIAEVDPFDFSRWPRGIHIQNKTVKGFASNHNAAFSYCDAKYYCVVNPDIRIISNPFPKMIAAMADPTVGLVAPFVLNPSGEIADSIRYFPTPFGILRKVFGMGEGRLPIERDHPQHVDWAAGMFMLFRAEAFSELGGFDEDFFLYYEDVDICTRLWKAGWKVMVQPSVLVIHNAQRASHRSLRHMRWHLSSMARYIIKHWARLPCVR
jgi:GT2 family glycosyltransferase